jgi:hypothetical protein
MLRATGRRVGPIQAITSRLGWGQIRPSDPRGRLGETRETPRRPLLEQRTQRRARAMTTTPGPKRANFRGDSLAPERGGSRLLLQTQKACCRRHLEDDDEHGQLHLAWRSGLDRPDLSAVGSLAEPEPIGAWEPSQSASWAQISMMRTRTLGSRLTQGLTFDPSLLIAARRA